MAQYDRWVRPLTASFFLILLSACSGLGGSEPPVHYYVLTAAAVNPSPGPAPAQHGPVISVAPVALPEYLNQAGITTRQGQSEMVRAGSDRWAGPLASEITRNVGENLSVMVPTDRLLLVGSAGLTVPVDFVVQIEIAAFERDQSNVVKMIARWSLFGEDGRSLVTMRTSRISRPTTGTDYDSTVAAMSGALEELCREIASAIQEGPPATRAAKVPRKAS